MKHIRKICSLLLLISLINLVSCKEISTSTIPVELKEEEKIITEVKEELPPPPIEITLTAIGDIMVHGPQLRAQYQADIDEHDFTNNFKYIKPYLDQADLVIGNLETTFAGKEKGYSSFPRFNSPDTLADALKEAGIDILATANNHTLDTGSQGMLRTIEVLEDKGFDVIGTRKEVSMDNYIIKDVKGVHIGLTAYTYETPMYGDFKTLNGLKIPKEIEGLINSFSYEFLEEDLLEMKTTIDKMKEAGAEVLVFYIHWGEEYQREPNHYQRYIAERLRGFGVDIILGSHPHVLQSIEFERSIEGQGGSVIAYSLGNFLSNQRYEILKNRYTEDGIIVNIKIRKNLQKKALAIDQVTYVPTWVYRYINHGKAVYEILPVIEALNNKEAYNLIDKEVVWRVENSKENTTKLLEDSHLPVVSHY